MRIEWSYTITEIIRKETLLHRGESIVHAIKHSEEEAERKMMELRAMYPKAKFAITKNPIFTND